MSGGAPLAGLGLRHVLIALGFCTAVELNFVLYALVFERTPQPGVVFAEMLTLFAVGMAAILSAVTVDNLFTGRERPALQFAIAVAASTVAGVILGEVIVFTVIGPLGIPLEGFEAGKFPSPAQRIVFRAAGAATWSLLLIVPYTMLETSRLATERLHGLQVTAVAAERALIEEGLHGMRTRLDPEWLYESLLRVNEAYGRELATGQEMLDALILQLRAATQQSSQLRSRAAPDLDPVDA